MFFDAIYVNCFPELLRDLLLPEVSCQGSLPVHKYKVLLTHIRWRAPVLACLLVYHVILSPSAAKSATEMFQELIHSLGETVCVSGRASKRN